MESRIEAAREKKASGKYNCAQAVACTYASAIGLDEEAVRSLTNAFGTGMGTMDGTCGALVGAGVIIGAASPDRATGMKRMKGIMTAFAARNGAVTCRQLKGIDTKCPLRDCNDCVADAAEFLEGQLAEII